MKTLISTEDNSVNFVTPCSEGGFFESRYVRRAEDYFICYLSSHSGCNKGCAMCHLTVTGQRMMTPASEADFLEQTGHVLRHYIKQSRAHYVNFNFMARGEPLDNPMIRGSAHELFNSLYDKAGISDSRLIPRFNISTIMPKTYRANLDKTFAGINPTIYYSLYSMNEKFRAKWLPGAMDPEIALDLLTEYQRSTKKIIKLHWAIIENENDSWDDVFNIVAAVKSRRLEVEFNCVRYNPYSEIDGRESPRFQIITDYLAIQLDCHAKIVSRVGQDVFASCGMFVEGI